MSRRRVPVDTPALALTRAEAAASLGLSVDVFDAAVRPYIACVRIGAVVTYPVDELRRWLEQNASSPVHDLDPADGRMRYDRCPLCLGPLSIRRGVHADGPIPLRGLRLPTLVV